MKIVVPVKEVAVLDEEFDLLEDRPGVDPDALEWELNEWDDFSLEAALQLREAQGEGEVVVVSIGDEEAEEGLRACLAKGADRALRVWDDVARGRRSAGGGAGARRRRGTGVAGARALRRAVERRGAGRDGRGARRAPGAAARGGRQVARLRRRFRLGNGGARARGRAHGDAAGEAARAAHDPDRHQRATLREPAGHQAGQGEAARAARAGRARASTTPPLAAAAGLADALARPARRRAAAPRC